MAGWEEAGEDRWIYTQDGAGADGSKNYLLSRGQRLTELHVSGNLATLHEYLRAEDAPPITTAEPLNNARWVRSTERVLPAAIGPDQAWALFEETDA